MPRPSAIRARRSGAACLAIASLLATPAAGQSPDRWAADAVEARAVLPLPRDNDRIGAAEMSCAAQKWTLRLDVAEREGLAGNEAEMRIDGNVFPVALAVTPEGVAISVPRAALPPLKAGLRLEIDFGGVLEEVVGDMTFSLRGSKLAIAAMEDRCTLRDMSAYQAVTFTPYSSYLNLARELRKADIEAFATATMSQPKMDVAMAEFGGDRRVLFTRMCGSSWYFGTSGCNVTGFAPRADMPEGQEEPAEAAEPASAWRVVYDTENVVMHTDPQSAVDGWPDLVTLPVRSAAPGRIWRWAGSGYELHGDLPEEPEDEPLPLRLGQN